MGDDNSLTHHLAGLGTKNALLGKWDDCTLKACQTPIVLGITCERSPSGGRESQEGRSTKRWSAWGITLAYG